MRAYANKHHRDVNLAVDDWVYLKLQPYRLKSLAKKLNEKLNPRFYGPYRISKVIGKVAYHLNLPLESNVHPVFHVSLLKKVIAPKVKHPNPSSYAD